MKFFSNLLVVLLLASGASFAQIPLDPLGNLEYDQLLSDVWGYVDNGTEYALVGVRNGTSIVNVSDPCNPFEVDFVDGPNTIWRDIKTWGNYAYVTNEGDEGIKIIDLSNLPGPVSSSNWDGGLYANSQNGFVSFETSHNIFIDENGIGYIVGANFGNRGCIIIDIAANPLNPPILNIYNDNYVHDVFVRGDTMWLSEINAGRMAIFDVSDKTNLQLIGLANTPDGAAHNAWVSDDNNYMFTTDETGGGKVTCFNVSNLSNIFIEDVYVSSLGGNDAVPHNVHVLGDYLVTSHYHDGITIVDISNPSNLVEVDAHDTSPNYSGQGFEGCWGAYPYLPSGRMLATDQQEGLFIYGDASTECIQRLEVQFKVLLEGPLDGNTMQTNLGNLIPLQQPYGSSPFNYAGTETLTNIPANMVDWVLVEVRNNVTPNISGARSTTTLATKAGILLNDGRIVDLDGVSALTFNNLDPSDAYYFCIRHRNHLDILTSIPLNSSNGSVVYDFTDNDSKALGPSQLKSMGFGKYAMYAGEFNSDGNIQNTDRDSWKSDPAILNTYNLNDGNLDGTVQVTDYDRWYENRTKAGVAEIDFN